MKFFIGSGKVATVIKNINDVAYSHSQIEVTDRQSVRDIISKLPKNSIVINTVSKINLEWCENNKEEAFDVNVTGAVNVAGCCAEFNHRLIHISSGCIFDGMEEERWYDEEDDPTPAAWYTKTKAEADRRLLNLGYPKITIVRPRQLVSKIINPTNMLTKFLSVKNGNFIDCKNSLTCIEDMGEMINILIAKEKYGVYNLANSGWITPYQIAESLRDKLDSSMQIKKIDYLDYLKQIKVKRVNTLLNIDKYIKDTGYTPRSADQALAWCILNYGRN